MAGARGEISNIVSQLLTLNKQGTNNYANVYPSLHTTFQISKTIQAQLNYSLRINRPEGEDLNPFAEYQDPYNIRQGNPYLLSEKIHSFELGFQWQKGDVNLTLTPYYRLCTNKMTQITRTMANGVMLTTKENLSQSTDGGLEAIFNYAFADKFTCNLSYNIFYDQIDASLLGYSKNKGALAHRAAINVNIYLTKRLALQINTRYNSKTLTPQGTHGEVFVTNAGMRYEFARQKLALSCMCSDVFNSYRDSWEINTPYLYQKIVKRRNGRTIFVGLTYKFGNNGKEKHNDILKDETL